MDVFCGNGNDDDGDDNDGDDNLDNNHIEIWDLKNNKLLTTLIDKNLDNKNGITYISSSHALTWKFDSLVKKIKKMNE